MPAMIKFYKYQGTGNDFIIINNFEQQQVDFDFDEIFLNSFCHRKWGIGADGLIVLNKHDQYDFEMQYYNADGSQSFCGNGSRCVVHLAHQLGIINGNEALFMAHDGLHKARMVDNFNVTISINDVHKNSITKLSTVESNPSYFIHTGSPHYVQIVDSLHTLSVVEEGKKINFLQKFQQQGTNVNFVTLATNGIASQIQLRTYERGVKDETYACGTGAVASALIVTLIKGFKSPVQVIMRGGILQVSFEEDEQKFTNIRLTGMATQVFQGAITKQQLQTSCMNYLMFKPNM